MFRRVLFRCVFLVAVLASCGTAAARPHRHARYVPDLRLAGTHGYKIDVASLRQGEGGPEVFVTIWNRDSETSYVAAGQVESDGYSASFGHFGWVDVHFERQRPRRVDGCDGRSEEEEPGRFTGTVEFHAERRFTEVSYPWLDTRSFSDPRAHCWSSDEGGSHGATLEGLSRWGTTKAIANGTGGRVRFVADAENKIGPVKIYRFLQAFGPTRDFVWSRRFRSARVTPPAPFQGTASYHATHEFGRWRGDLSVDFPGFPRYPLTMAPTFGILKPGGCKVRGFHRSTPPSACL